MPGELDDSGELADVGGHQRSRHGELDGGSRIGARYRHTTDAMMSRGWVTRHPLAACSD